MHITDMTERKIKNICLPLPVLPLAPVTAGCGGDA